MIGSPNVENRPGVCAPKMCKIRKMGDSEANNSKTADGKAILSASGK